MGGDYRSLMTRYQAGDREAAAALYHRLTLDLPQLVRSLAPDFALDDRLVEEICLEIHRARSSYHPRSRFEPWLMAIVQHVCGRHRQGCTLLARLRARFGVRSSSRRVVNRVAF